MTTGGKEKVPLPGWSEKIAQGILSGQFVKACVTAKERALRVQSYVCTRNGHKMKVFVITFAKEGFSGRRLSVLIVSKITREVMKIFWKYR